MNKLGWHVVDQTNDGVGEQQCALEHENSEQSPEERLADVDTGLARRLLWVTLKRCRRSCRAFGFEDGRETRRELVLAALVLDRHLLVELAILRLRRHVSADRSLAFEIVAGASTGSGHVVVDLSFEVVIEGHGAARSSAVLMRHCRESLVVGL